MGHAPGEGPGSDRSASAAANIVSTTSRSYSLEGHAVAASWLTPARVRGEPVIVFLHEALGSIRQWKDFPAGLCAATELRGLVFDRLGHGLSSPLPGRRSPDYLREEGEDRLPEILRAAGIDRPVLFGNSDGGSIALYFAAAHAATAVICEAAHVVLEEFTLEGIRRFADSWATTDVAQRLARSHGDKTEALFHNWHDTWLSPAFARFDMTDRLSRITCPSLVIQGGLDQYGSAAQVKAIVDGIGAPARAWILPEAGHAPHLEQQELVIDRVRAFLSEVSP
jgi:pimeloyl-ACP methyl ester carboxylesterase